MHLFWRLVLRVMLVLVGGSLLLAAAVAAPPTTAPLPVRPASQPTTSNAGVPPASRPTSRSAADRERARRLIQLTRRAIEFMEKHKYPEAETTLTEALALDPKHETNLYNMACLKALTEHPNQALDYLEKAADAGFTDFIHIEKDSDLETLRNLPRYKKLIARKGEYQLRAAQAALEGLKKEFGEGYLYEIDDADKLIFATNTDQATLEALKKMLMSQARSQWDQIFANKPDQFIVVVVPSAVDYRKIVQMPGVEGFYNHSARTLIAKGLGFVTQHEFTHAMHAADLDPLGQDHPIWLVEGMAVMFEHAEYDDAGVLTPMDNMRLAHLQAMARVRRLVPLAKMLAMTQREFVGQADVCYAEAGSVMHYLYDTKLLRPFYDKVKDLYEKDHTGKMALEEVTGKTLEQFEQDWRAWMMKRTPPRIPKGSSGPYLGLRFEQANDGIRVSNAVPGGPAFRAGVRDGDLIVGLGAVDVRDVPTFMPLLAQHQPGDHVVLKVRRGSTYMDIPVNLGSRAEIATTGIVGGGLMRPGRRTFEAPPATTTTTKATSRPSASIPATRPATVAP